MRQKFRCLAVAIALSSVAPAAYAQININTQYNVEQSVGGGYVVPDIGWAYDLTSPFSITGINTIFGPNAGTDRLVTVELFQGGPPATGGTLLRSATFNSAIARNVLGGGTFAPLLLAPGTYFIGYLNILDLLNIVDATGRPVAVSLPTYADQGDGQFANGPNFFPASSKPILQLTGSTVIATPEPATAMLVVTGLIGLGTVARRRTRAT